MCLADVHPGPDLGHVHLRQLAVSRQPADDLADVVLTAAIESRLPIGGRVVAGLRAAKSFEPSNGCTHDSHTQSPRALRSYE